MSTKLGEKAVGSIVYLNVGGTKKQFLVVHQGKPSSLYHSSCDGTWLLMRDIYEKRRWHSSNSNSYKDSTIHSYLNSTFLGLFDADTQRVIKNVKIPYVNGTGNSPVASGSSGLDAQIFLLSGYEVGFTQDVNQTFLHDGAKLDYFISGDESTAKAKRIAYLNETATIWWMRTPYTISSSTVVDVTTNGNWHYEYPSDYCGVRPALVLDSSLLVSDDGSVQANSAPTVPGIITIPSTIMGGTTITVSWGSSTDPDGNFEGYIVERSTNGGTSWSQIYQGNGTNTTNTVAFGTTSVMYRVKAYDSEGEASEWMNSSQVTVINNTAPGAPSSISVPNDVRGGSTLVISWGSASDSDGNLSGYKLERSIDGGTYSEIYNGISLTYTDTITNGWATVQYRVNAYDPYSESDYTTSEKRTVDNNSYPTIACNYSSGANLGKKTSDFSIDYSVNDADPDDSVTVTEKLDGVVKRTYTATKGAKASFTVTGDYFQKVLNGSHTIMIEATDGKATVTHIMYFTKEVTEAIVTLAEPMEADDVISICAISVAGSIPADATFKIEVTNNGNDNSPVWEDYTGASQSGKNYLFQNKSAANGFAFNFRVTLKRGSSGAGGYITSIQGGFQ